MGCNPFRHISLRQPARPKEPDLSRAPYPATPAAAHLRKRFGVDRMARRIELGRGQVRQVERALPPAGAFDIGVGAAFHGGTFMEQSAWRQCAKINARLLEFPSRPVAEHLTQNVPVVEKNLRRGHAKA